MGLLSDAQKSVCVRKGRLCRSAFSEDMVVSVQLSLDLKTIQSSHLRESPGNKKVRLWLLPLHLQGWSWLWRQPLPTKMGDEMWPLSRVLHRLS